MKDSKETLQTYHNDPIRSSHASPYVSDEVNMMLFRLRPHSEWECAGVLSNHSWAVSVASLIGLKAAPARKVSFSKTL